MGFHLRSFADPATDDEYYIPTASGFAGNYVIMYAADDLVSVRMAEAWPDGQC